MRGSEKGEEENFSDIPPGDCFGEAKRSIECCHVASLDVERVEAAVEPLRRLVALLLGRVELGRRGETLLRERLRLRLTLDVLEPLHQLQRKSKET